MGVADEYPRSLHYENLPIQRFILAIKIEKFSSEKENEIFLIFAQNIDCGCTLEPPHRGKSECERHI